MNELALTGGNAVNPFEAAAAKAQHGSIVGSLLKFSKGDYLAGQENADVPAGTKVVVNMDQILTGWIRWVDSKPKDQIMGLLAKGYQTPLRETLGYTDEDRWETDDQGKKRDPWQETFYVLMKDIEQDELLTFTTSSIGGKNAIYDLCREFGKVFQSTHANDYPIVALNTGSYPHPNKSYGRVKYPKFDIVGWSPRVEFGGNTDDTGDVSDGDQKQIANASEAASQAQTEGRPATTKF